MRTYVFLTRRSHSMSFTRAQGIPKNKSWGKTWLMGVTDLTMHEFVCGPYVAAAGTGRIFLPTPSMWRTFRRGASILCGLGSCTCCLKTHYLLASARLHCASSISSSHAVPFVCDGSLCGSGGVVQSLPR